MKHLKTQKQLNEESENLNISDVNNSFCNLYKKKCMGGLCSITPFPQKCKYLKQKELIKCDKGWHSGECCCNCGNHYEDFYHCSTTPKPEGVEGCVCNIHKGYICLIQFEDGTTPQAHSNWPEHGFCEMWRPK